MPVDIALDSLLALRDALVEVEEKRGVGKVRSQAGVRKYHAPIGTPIVKKPGSSLKPRSKRTSRDDGGGGGGRSSTPDTDRGQGHSRARSEPKPSRQPRPDRRKPESGKREKTLAKPPQPESYRNAVTEAKPQNRDAAARTVVELENETLEPPPIQWGKPERRNGWTYILAEHGWVGRRDEDGFTDWETTGPPVGYGESASLEEAKQAVQDRLKHQAIQDVAAGRTPKNNPYADWAREALEKNKLPRQPDAQGNTRRPRVTTASPNATQAAAAPDRYELPIEGAKDGIYEGTPEQAHKDWPKAKEAFNEWSDLTFDDIQKMDALELRHMWRSASSLNEIMNKVRLSEKGLDKDDHEVAIRMRDMAAMAAAEEHARTFEKQNLPARAAYHRARAYQTMQKSRQIVDPEGYSTNLDDLGRHVATLIAHKDAFKEAWNRAKELWDDLKTKKWNQDLSKLKFDMIHTARLAEAPVPEGFNYKYKPPEKKRIRRTKDERAADRALAKVVRSTGRSAKRQESQAVSRIKPSTTRKRERALADVAREKERGKVAKTQAGIQRRAERRAVRATGKAPARLERAARRETAAQTAEAMTTTT